MAQPIDPYDVLNTLLAASRWINTGERLCNDLGIPVDMFHPREAYDACAVKVKAAQEAAEEILKNRNAPLPNFGRFGN